uniref:CSON013603 protein n=1 Tax=Culicoides sonorensis TaxID=179676 RepID=A0A336KQ85_CULSO
MNRMLKKSSIFIDENIELVQTRMVTPNTEKYSSLKLARSQSSDEATLSVLVADKLWSFFKSRSLKWKVFNLADFVMGSDDDGQLNIGLSVNSKKLYEEGRGKLKNSGHIIGALLAKAALVGALIFKGLVLLVGKALIVSKLAFLLASILAVKKLLSKKHITYEVVAHPVHDLHHEHPTSGWGRALDELIDNQMNFISGDQIAYKGHQ